MMVSSYISLELDRGYAHQQAQEKEHGAHLQAKTATECLISALKNKVLRSW
jgi:hypothetical protein